MDSIYANLGWLPRPPADFNALCRTALNEEEALGARLRDLAGYALDENQLLRVAKVVEKARAAGRSLHPLVPYRLGVVTNSTTDFIVPALIATALRHGIALECVTTAYGQAIQESLSPDSALNRSAAQATLIAIDWRGVPLQAAPGSPEEAAAAVRGGVGYLGAIRDGLRRNSAGICIVQNFAPPPETLFGSLDRTIAGTQRQILAAVNAELAGTIAGSGDVLCDIAGLAETVGLAHWHSPAAWNMAKLPFAQEFLPLYADHVCRIVAALCGKSRRCLVLDLDNTLWGGVIGDDGLKGIQIAQGDAAGEAYLEFQRYILALRGRGVVLAVSSKNEDATARLPFHSHPEMLLREEHFGVFQANWSDKATNIRSIADELALGLESFVFVDDNPFERELVRRMLPQVAVPEMPPNPAYYARMLSAAGYFESAVFSAEDMKRASYYEGNARRAALQQNVGDLDAYLASLEMEITFQPFDETGRARIVQLINKSNQFNLTTRRYTEAQVERFENDPECFTLQVRLTDRFGDNGMISVVICRPAGPARWDIDTWLMSCRVLGRRVEQMVLRELLDHARRRGIREIAGTYYPTDRNHLVEQHYAKLGFAAAGAGSDGATRWTLAVDGAEVETAPMKVRSTGFAATQAAAAE